jgi:predicted Zn-dependent protease
MKAIGVMTWLLILAASSAAVAADVPRCQVHVILFMPSDVAPPRVYQPRVNEIANYTEAFFRRELKRWGHEKVVMPFRRSADGQVEVMMMRGKQKTSQYKPVSLRMEVMDELRRKNKINDAKQIWWIMVYAGDPPARFAAFLGGFGPQIGGWAVCNFDTTPGRIDPNAQLGSPFLEKIALKGMIHELGHGFGLPHIGPLKRDNGGNTLMGPTHHNFGRVIANEDRVYLSEAEAALFATHPAFRGAVDDRGQLPKVQVQNMKYAPNPQKKAIVVSGRVQGSQRAVYALVADESDERPGEYWTKTFVGKVGPDGAFEVMISEPAQTNGTLKTWFIFENGAHTGDGKSRSRESAIAKSYTYSGRQWTFN